MQRFIPTLQPVEEAVSPFGSTCSPMTPAGQYKLDDDRPRLSCSSLPQTWNSTLRNTEESANKRIDWDIVEDEDPSTTDSTPARTSAQNTPTRNSVTDGLSRLVHETLNTLGAKSDEWRSMDEAQRFCSPTSENSLQKPIRVSLRQLHNPEDAEGSNSPITEGIESKREATAMFGSLSQLDEMCENHRTNNPSKLGETAECPHARTVEDQETRSTVCLSETYLSPTSSTDQSEEKHANCLGVLRSQVKNIETVRTSRNRSVLEEDYTPRGIPTNFSTIFSNDAKSPPLDCMGHPTAHPERSLSPRRTMQNASMYRKSITRKRKLEDPIKTEGSSNENESLDGPRQLRQRTFRISYKEPSLRSVVVNIINITMNAVIADEG